MRTDTLEALENSAMDSVELSHDACAAEKPSAEARACGIDSVEEWSREVEDTCKDPRAALGQVAEEDQEACERQHEEEPEQDMEEDLAVCPPGIVAGLAPDLLRDRRCHSLKFPPPGLKIRLEESASFLNVRTYV
ncbi:MAG TPA: hypothetical protein VJA66_15130 [Thermoanaerobaculia bacterium]